MLNHLPRTALILAAVLASTLAFAADDKKAAAPKPAAPAPANPAIVKTSINEQAGAESSAQSAQKQINEIDDRTQSAVSEYRATIQETESLRRYNAQLAAQVKSQEDEVQQILKDIQQIEITAREILPLIQKMMDTLEQFVKLDTPFLPEERSQRINSLKDMMTRADVSIAEKYRRTVEAYQVEMEYGRTIEAYQGKIQDKTVDFLRLGRVSLMYQALDGDATGYWDAEKKAWVEDSDYRDYVKRGLKVAKKATAPDLLVVPVTAPQESK